MFFLLWAGEHQIRWLYYYLAIDIGGPQQSYWLHRFGSIPQ
ncbi:uncharacterized protein METZ01_LOCUS127393 [marine metagenome]|uniref:Uncharacterized protein n=1 Tax=marine metagenome TaxID=408172 RepID=A0A381YBR5_9ZZZZ